MVRELVEQDHLPDYRVSLENEMVLFTNRMMIRAKPAEARYPVLDPETTWSARSFLYQRDRSVLIASRI